MNEWVCLCDFDIDAAEEKISWCRDCNHPFHGEDHQRRRFRRSEPKKIRLILSLLSYLSLVLRRKMYAMASGCTLRFFIEGCFRRAVTLQAVLSSQMTTRICKKHGISCRRMDPVVVSEFSLVLKINPIILLVVDETTKILLQSLVVTLSLAISLHMIARRKLSRNAEKIEHVLPKR